MSDDFEFGWAVGLFEGEGWITTQNPPRHNLRLGVEMADLAVLQRFAAAVGVGRIAAPRKRSERWRELWAWTTGGQAEAEALLARMLPHLGDRRKRQAEVALAKRSTYLTSLGGEKDCEGCGATFLVDPSQRNSDRRRFCTRQCGRRTRRKAVNAS